MKRITLFLLILITTLPTLVAPSPTDASQPQRPDQEQIRTYLSQHPLTADAEILAVTIQGEALVIDLSAALLPDGLYQEGLFTQLELDLDRALQVNHYYLTTFLVAGQPLEAWGRPIPDFAPIIDQAIIQEPGRAGPLSRIKIALNPGHGVYWNEVYSAWYYQRSLFWGIREDIVNSQIVGYLQAALIGQGATVIPLRELNQTAPPGLSGLPAWHEAARHYAIAQGLPDWTYNGGSTNLNSDIRARPYMANYYGAHLLINLHNNGWDGTFTGTETYWDVKNPRSLTLANAVHGSIIQTIRQDYDPGWTNRGIKATDWDYAEIYYAHMPAVLIELAFMDHPKDNRYLQDEAFKILAARAITTGICQFAGVTCEQVWPPPVVPTSWFYFPLITQ
jgi:N-acetylmuramoyl-L-alanine amidase